MFNLGQQLYQLTQRDLVGIGADPFFRTFTGNAPAAQSFGLLQIPLELDRALYLHAFSAYLINTALATWTSFLIAAENAAGQSVVLSRGGNNTQLNGDNGAGGVGASVMVSRTLQIVVPPQTRRLSFIVTRTDLTNQANFELALNGYYIPPGRIGRFS